MSILRNSYNLSFKVKPFLTRNPIVKSRSANALEQLHAGDFTFPFRQTVHRNGQGSILTSLLQWPLLGSQTQQQVAPFSRPQLAEQVPEDLNLQNGNTRINQGVITKRTGHPLDFSDVYFHISISRAQESI